MFDEFEKEDDQWRPEGSRVVKIIKKSLKWSIAALTIALIGFLVLRMITSNPPGSMKKVVWNDTLLNAYNTAKAEKSEFEVLQIPADDSFSSKPTVDGQPVSETYGEDGMFSIYTIVYIPQAKQLQFTVRINDRSLNYLSEDYPEAIQMDKDGQELYTYSLSVRREEETATVSDYSYTCAHRFGYTYRRLIFDNIELEGVTSVKLNVAFAGKPTVVRQTVNIYSSASFPSIKALPDFGYKAPSKVTDGIKTKQG